MKPFETTPITQEHRHDPISPGHRGPLIDRLIAPAIAKPRWELLPIVALEDVVRAFTHGAGRRGDFDWQGRPDPRAEHLGAAYRHIAARMRGEIVDADSGVHHLGCAGARLLMLGWHDHQEAER